MSIKANCVLVVTRLRRVYIGKISAVWVILEVQQITTFYLKCKLNLCYIDARSNFGSTVLVRTCQRDTRQIPHSPFPSLHYPVTQRLRD